MHDVFISFSSQNHAAADAACRSLESHGVKCWISSRDVPAGTNYAEEIIHAIENCQVVVLIFSAHANSSPHVHREVERASSKNKPIVQYRIENISPSGSMEYFLGNTHWLDACTPPIEKRAEELVASVRRLLGKQPPPADVRPSTKTTDAEKTQPASEPQTAVKKQEVIVIDDGLASDGIHVSTPRNDIRKPPPEKDAPPPVIHADAYAEAKVEELEAKVKELGQSVEKICAENVLSNFVRKIGEDSSTFSEWQSTAQAALEGDKSVLDKKIACLEEVEKEIAAQDEELSRTKDSLAGNDAIAAFNARVQARNSLVERHRADAEEYRLHLARYNEKVDALNQEIRQRHEKLLESNKKIEADLTAHQKWLKDRGPQKTAHELNEVYAFVRRRGRRQPEDPQWSALLGRISSLREKFQQYAIKHEAESERGMLLVEVVVENGDAGFQERAIALADNAASFACISPSLAYVLGIEPSEDDEIELSLPNGIYIKAPQVVIPALVVNGVKAEFVKAVILKESMIGVDVTLGLSFLTKFDFEISKGKPQQLKLSPRQQSAGGSGFDVFICHKTEDRKPAAAVYHALRAAGYKPFLSEESLPNLRSSDFLAAIDEALESARHLVVVTSSRKNIESRWVAAEWRMFDNLLRSERKSGNVLTMLCDDMKVDDLPVGLSRHTVISMSQPDWKEVLVKYLPA